MKYLKLFEEFHKIVDTSNTGSTKYINTIHDDPTSAKSLSAGILLRKDLRDKEYADIMDIIGSSNIDRIPRTKLDVTANNMRFLKDSAKKGELRCEYCKKGPLIIYDFGDKFIQKDGATCDHKVPKSKGGDKFNYSNLAVCCYSCNKRKGDMNYHDWIELISSGK